MQNNNKGRIEEDLLLKKIVELEESQARFKQTMSMFTDPNSNFVSPRCAVAVRHSIPLGRESRDGDPGASTSSGPGDVTGEPEALKFSKKVYMNILQSMGQGVHIWDIDRRLIYWNQSAEEIYGYNSDEAIGRDAVEFLVDPHDYDVAHTIIDRVLAGETWSGQFPFLHKKGQLVQVIATNTPIHDDNGSAIGVICVSSNANCCTHPSVGSKRTRSKSIVSAKFGLDPSQPLPSAIASKISDLATKVKTRLGVSENTSDVECGIGDGQNHEDGEYFGVPVEKFGVFGTFISPYGEEQAIRHISDYSKSIEAKPGLERSLSSKVEIWMSKKVNLLPWKGSERERPRIVWPWVRNNESCGRQNSGAEPAKVNNNVVHGSCSSSVNANSTTSASTAGSSNVNNKVDAESDSLDFKIVWEDLAIQEHIGEGSTATVYHGHCYGSDIAVKIFNKQEYTDDVLRSFKQEVSIMKKLRHPNILLYMGAVASNNRLCIVTEFLARGSLLRILHRSTVRLDWKRRAHMAMDIARGMNYLHHLNPPVVHCDLKSSNLLVDKNWTIKVGDFGLARLKNEKHLPPNSGKGTAQWMAPEVLRDEPFDEKSDVYSYGVVLWEILTQKIPWEHLNPMQVIGAVGYMGHRLEMPENVEPEWIQIMESCWHSEPGQRPTFIEVMEKVRELYKTFALRARNARGESSSQSQQEEP